MEAAVRMGVRVDLRVDVMEERSVCRCGWEWESEPPEGEERAKGGCGCESGESVIEQEAWEGSEASGDAGKEVNEQVEGGGGKSSATTRMLHSTVDSPIAFGWLQRSFQLIWKR